MSNQLELAGEAASKSWLSSEIVATALAVAGIGLLLLTQATLAFLAALTLLLAAFAVRPPLGLPTLAFVLPFYLQGRGLGQMAFSPPELVLLCLVVGLAVHRGGRLVWAGGVGGKLRRYTEEEGGRRTSVGDEAPMHVERTITDEIDAISCESGRTPCAPTSSGSRRRGQGPISYGLRRYATALDSPIALFLAAALLSLLASEVLRVSLRELRTVVLEPVAAYYLAVHLMMRRQEVVGVTAGLLLGGLAAAGLGIYQYFLTDHVVAVEGVRRILGPYSSPNELGLYLGRILPIATAIALYLPSVRWPSALLAAISGAALLLTFSLGAWLASLLALLLVVLLWQRNRRTAPWTARVLVGSVVVVAVVAAFSTIGNERITSHFAASQGTSFVRVQLWESSARMVADHPLFGVGMDNFLYLYRTDYLPTAGMEEPNLSHPHNMPLNFWLEMGVPGLVAWLWLLAALASTWIEAWRSAPGPADRAMLAGIAGAAVDLVAHGMVDNSYFRVDLAFQFWLVVALLVWLGRSADENDPGGDQQEILRLAQDDTGGPLFPLPTGFLGARKSGKLRWVL